MSYVRAFRVVILDDVKRMHQVASTNLSDEKADFMLR